MNPQVRAISDHIVFQFEDEFVKKSANGGAEQNHFVDKTDWGFSIVETTSTVSNGRWGIVISVGPLCTDAVKEGMRVFIEPLKWTNSVEFEGSSYWRTNEESILLIDDGFEY